MSLITHGFSRKHTWTLLCFIFVVAGCSTFVLPKGVSTLIHKILVLIISVGNQIACKIVFDQINIYTMAIINTITMLRFFAYYPGFSEEYCIFEKEELTILTPSFNLHYKCSTLHRIMSATQAWKRQTAWKIYISYNQVPKKHYFRNKYLFSLN